ncbi:hypothetical protein BLNAU_22142 [Blattamonas nauphoetae]|uniref:Uncharacterized protein n=1 Tax=Blattamonas nauphoetae TaxID=2049346 RepID=A0ABQ9WTW6_9EUKA|nr:hypothetical protein BLNAU_22142 [Blattamonas nauphoetae]
MTLFVLSSSIALTYTECLDCYENGHLISNLLESVREGVRAWKREGPAVRKRGQQILAKLCEEGLSDEIELRFKDGSSNSISIADVSSLIRNTITSSTRHPACRGDLLSRKEQNTYSSAIRDNQTVAEGMAIHEDQ